MYQITYRGTIHDTQGYSRAAREYILALDGAGVDVRIEPVNYGTPPIELPEEKTNRLRELIQKPLAEGKKKILLYHSQPNAINPTLERKKGFDKVIINTVWETDKIPDNWVQNSQDADAILVPSDFCIQAFKDSGITTPIYLAPHGSDPEMFYPTGNPIGLKGTEDTFNFLSVFKWEHRKAPEVLLKAYWEEFNSDDNVSLILKIGGIDSKESVRQINQFLSSLKRDWGFADNSAPIYYSGSMFNENDLVSLYNSADVFVLPSRGEGVGLPYMEAMCSALPVIATRFGGQMDFVNGTNGYLVDYELSPSVGNYIAPSYSCFTEGMRWAEPRVESLKQIMRYSYQHQEEALAKGIRARADMLDMPWSLVINKMIEAIEEVVNS